MPRHSQRSMIGRCAMTSQPAAQLNIAAAATRDAATVEMRCTGAWTVHGIAELDRHLGTLSWPERGDVVVDGSALSSLDTSGAWILHRTVCALEKRGCAVRVQGL